MRSQRRSVFWSVVLSAALAAWGCGDDDGMSPDAGGHPDVFSPTDADLADVSIVEGAYYVAPDGDDSAPGTADQPWRTLAHAAATAQAGDTVYLRAGTYHERLVPENDGTAAEPITFAGYPGEEAVIDGTGVTLPAGWGGLVEVSYRSYIVLEGLVVQHAGPDDNHAGVLVQESQDVIVRGCHTYDTASSGIGVWRSTSVTVEGNEVVLACNDGEQECITVAITDGFQVSGNHVHDSGPGSNGGEGIDVKDGSSNGVVFGNRVHDINRLGIYVDAWDKHTFDIEVHSNVAYHCAGSGFAVAAENGGLLENVWLYNNVAYANQYSGMVVGGWGVSGAAHPIDGVTISNNTFAGNGTDTSGWGPGITLENPEADNLTIRNNVLWGNGYEQLEATDFGANLVVTHNLFSGAGAPYGTDTVLEDPQFMDVLTADFHLSPGSPAIDTGTSMDAPAFDFDGVARPQGTGIDLGAFEFSP